MFVAVGVIRRSGFTLGRTIKIALGRTVYSTTCIVVCIRQNSQILDALNEPVINYLRLVLGSPLLITVEVDKKEVNLIN